MTTINRVQGDVNDTATIALTGITDLTTATAVAAYVKLQSLKATLDCTIPDPNGVNVVIALGGANGWLATAAPGPWKLEIEVTFNNGSKLTWPDDGTDTIAVRADLD